MHFVLSFAILFAASVEAAVGPIAELIVSNAQRSPDGFQREYVIHYSVKHDVALLMPMQHDRGERPIP